MSSTAIWSLVLLVSLLVFIFWNIFSKNRNQKVTIATGFILWQSIDNWVDYVVYPAALLILGPWWGFATMFVITLAGNTAYVIINNKTTADWTLMSTFLQLRWVKMIHEWKVGGVQVGKFTLFTVITVKFDSFWALNFLYGKNVDLRRPKVVILFLVSHLICNAGWGGLWVGAISLFNLFT